MADISNEQADVFAKALVGVLPPETVESIAVKALAAAFRDIEYGSTYAVREAVKDMVMARTKELMAGEYAPKLDAAARKVLERMVPGG